MARPLRDSQAPQLPLNGIRVNDTRELLSDDDDDSDALSLSDLEPEEVSNHGPDDDGYYESPLLAKSTQTSARKPPINSVNKVLRRWHRYRERKRAAQDSQHQDATAAEGRECLRLRLDGTSEAVSTASTATHAYTQ